MMRKTPLGRVLGLGSAKAGTEHWWVQRVTAVAGIPLTVFLIGFILTHIGASRAEMLASLAEPAGRHPAGAHHDHTCSGT